MGHSWSLDDDMGLEVFWGEYGANVIAERLGRSQRAVVERARRLGLGPQRQGTKTLSELCEETGYSKSRIKTAAAHLRINLRRVPRGDPRHQATKRRWHAIDEDTQGRLLEYLASIPDGRRIYKSQQGEWGGPRHRGGRKPEACIDCSRSDVPHFCRGRCRNCDRRWRAGKSPLMPGTGLEPARA